MKKSKKTTKIPYDFPPQVEKTSLNRLAGIVIGARADLMGNKSIILRILAPAIVFFVYLASSLLLLPFIGFKAPYVILIAAFSLGGVLWYKLIERISGRIIIAFLTLILWISPLFAVSANDLLIKLSPQLYLSFIALDYSHIIGLSLTPIPLYFIIRFLNIPSYKNLVLSILFVAVITLISPFALLNLLFFAFIFSCSEMLLGMGRIKLLRFLLIIICGLTLTAFWYHPVFIFNLIKSREWLPTIAAVKNIIPFVFFVVPVLGTISFLIFDRKPQLQPIFISVSLFIIYGLIHYSERALTYKVVPVPIRFLPELIFSVSLLLSIFFSNLSFFIAAFSLRIKKKPSVFLERVPYIITSFILGFILFSTLLTILNNYYILNSDISSQVKGATSVILEGNSANWFSGSGDWLSHLIGASISLGDCVFLFNLRLKFNKL